MAFVIRQTVFSMRYEMHLDTKCRYISAIKGLNIVPLERNPLRRQNLSEVKRGRFGKRNEFSDKLTFIYTAMEPYSGR